MNITADTNLLVRAIIIDDAAQTEQARAALGEAELVALTLPALCELVWMLRQGYKNSAVLVAGALRGLLGAENVVLDRAAVIAGLAMLEAGADFADGVIAHEGRMLGGEVFVSFDKRAVNRLQLAGVKTRLLT